MNAVSNQTREQTGEQITRKVSFTKNKNVLRMFLVAVPYNGANRNVLAVKKAGYPDSDDITVKSRYTVVWAVDGSVKIRNGEIELVNGKTEIKGDNVWCRVSPIDEDIFKKAVVEKLGEEGCGGPYIF